MKIEKFIFSSSLILWWVIQNLFQLLNLDFSTEEIVGQGVTQIGPLFFFFQYLGEIGSQALQVLREGVTRKYISLDGRFPSNTEYHVSFIFFDLRNSTCRANSYYLSLISLVWRRFRKHYLCCAGGKNQSLMRFTGMYVRLSGEKA